MQTTPLSGRREFLRHSVTLSLIVPLQGAITSADALAASTVPSLAPGAFLRVDADSQVTVICKHLEMGQGTHSGLAAIVADERFDVARLSEHLARELPAYARPLFLRFRPKLDLTGTFKPRKVDLMKEGFDPVRITTPLYVLDRDAGYIPLTAELHDRIIAGTVRL